jgi:glycosyltransferase involved in cell wall biosynthesis
MKIVGMGPLFRPLEQEIERYGLEKKVTLVGSKTEEEIRELFLQADAKLFTGIIASNGDRDGIPNVIPEAMSAGCLILASHFAGASEAFTDGVSGFSFHPEHFEEWTCVLEDFGRYPSKYHSIRKKAQISCRQMFDVSNTARSLIRNFQDIIHRNETS